MDAPPDGAAPASNPPTGACRDGWCWVYPLPQGNALRGIGGTSATDVWATGDRGTAIHFDGTTWTEHPAPGSSRVVHALAANDVWTGGGTLNHWNGTAWSTYAAPGQIYAVGGVGPWASAYVGASSALVQWDGTSWNTKPLPVAGWRVIQLFAAGGETYAISEGGGYAKWLGSAWGVATAESGQAFVAAVGIDATHLVAITNHGVFQSSGTSWTPLGVAPSLGVWRVVSASSLSDVWIAGPRVNGPADAYHWDGTSWTAHDTGVKTGTIEALWRDGSGHLWAAFTDAGVMMFDGTSWIEKTFGRGGRVTSVWGTSANDIWVVSTSGTGIRTTHWDGATWSDIANPLVTGGYRGTGIWGSAPNDYWIGAGLVVPFQNDFITQHFLMHWNGTAWQSFGPFGSDMGAGAGVEHVWGSSATDVYAQARTAIYHFDGVSWTPVTGGPTGGTDVFGTSATDVHVVDGTKYWTWNGIAWSSVTSPGTIVLGWMNSAADVWFGGSFLTRGFHFDGTFWVQSPIMIDGLLGTASEMFSTNSSLLSRWPGFGGARTETPAFFQIESGWRAPDGRLFSAGTGEGASGGVLVYDP